MCSRLTVNLYLYIFIAYLGSSSYYYVFCIFKLFYDCLDNISLKMKKIFNKYIHKYKRCYLKFAQECPDGMTSPHSYPNSPLHQYSPHSLVCGETYGSRLSKLTIYHDQDSFVFIIITMNSSASYFKTL